MGLSKDEMAAVAEKVAPHLAGLTDEQADRWHALFSVALDEGVTFDEACEAADALCKETPDA